MFRSRSFTMLLRHRATPTRTHRIRTRTGCRSQRHGKQCVTRRPILGASLSAAQSRPYRPSQSPPPGRRQHPLRRQRCQRPSPERTRPAGRERGVTTATRAGREMEKMERAGRRTPVSSAMTGAARACFSAVCHRAADRRTGEARQSHWGR